MKKIITLIFASVFVSLGFVSCVSSNTEEPKQEAVQPKKTKTAAQLEYERATKDLKGEVVSMDTYEKDKKEILAKISELNTIMKNRDYKSWVDYIEPNSVQYWSQKKNLSSASKQLPVKGIQLKNLEDYFNYVFVPSRMGRKIDEVRYISTTSVKAVQVRNEDIVIFYNFKKINGEWFVELPAL